MTASQEAKNIRIWSDVARLKAEALHAAEQRIVPTGNNTSEPLPGEVLVASGPNYKVYARRVNNYLLLASGVGAPTSGRC
jgi:hypothetical protein